MDSLLLGSFPKASVMTSGRNSWRSRSYTKGCYASSYLRTASWQNAWKVQNDIQITRFFQNNNKGMGRGYTCPKSARKYIVNAASEQSFESEPGAYDPKNIWHSVTRALDAFYRFSRPHTVIGTALSILSVSLLAVEKLSDLSPLFFTGVLQAVVAALFMNIYIVGLNQLSDVEIDKSFWLGWIVGSWPLFWALFISFVLGTAYSINLPMLRWKRFAVIAAMCILAVRAVIVQLAFFLHIQTHVFKRPALFSRPLVFATGFMSFFSVVIALFKDIPDIEGDKVFGIQSFSVRLGQKRVFWICVSLLEMAYGVALLVGAASPCLWSKIITGLGHAILASILWYQAKSLDLKSKAAITSFYMFIWKLFYAEYFLIPLVK
ncbi:homogentisate phytyltransferase 1, chloroplastic isoform X3 [Prosopis cineraria]|uniref:homogentisate phytyltransferase 1, chloroplastic isoform X3 n=1 Tax=Prosopis cineraria TaxID=364024 RepID=UPI0024104ECA|nr:homogentisate phytyltransferase 1, chloroplastic isoform X3 [Prosopis cineraria]